MTLVISIAGLSRVGRLTSGKASASVTAQQPPPNSSAAAGKQVVPAVAWFWKALCHAESPESIASAVSQLSVDFFTYELVCYQPSASHPAMLDGYSPRLDAIPDIKWQSALCRACSMTPLLCCGCLQGCVLHVVWYLMLPRLRKKLACLRPRDLSCHSKASRC